MNIEEKYKEYVKDAINYIKEQANNPEVNEFTIYLSLSELSKYYDFKIEDIHSWEGYYETSIVNICGRRWSMNAVGYYGYIEFEDAKYYGWED